LTNKTELAKLETDGENGLSIVHQAEVYMATNPPKDNSRIGMVRQRSQTFNPTTETWVKRDTETGRFMDVKSDGTPFKGVRKER